MKKMDLLSVKVRHEKPQMVLSIFLSVVFFSSPLSGLLNPGKDLTGTERPFHANPMENNTFFNLIPVKNTPEDTTLSHITPGEAKESAKDTTTDILLKYKSLNVVIW
jgi:hypothetical protein